MERVINSFSDPGHGWARVKKTELIKLGIEKRITTYSYQRGMYAYLEEDCDLGVYIEALKAKGHTYKFKHYTTDKRSKIRSYEHYSYLQS